jgi:DNA (cytosine-5)-methyltransferase 1
VIAACLAPLPPGGQGRLLPTPDTGTSPRGHGRRGGRTGNGHQSGAGIDAAARDAARPGSRWSEYVPAIRRWERVLGCLAPPPAQPGPGGRPWLSAEFAEWMMGIPGLVTRVPGIARTRQLRIIGNGVVPQQASMALRLLIEAAGVPAPPAPGTRMPAAA